jgi:hypothetical protein
VQATPSPPLDERELRAAQAAVGALLFGAFVFRVPLLVVAITVAVAAGAALGPTANALHMGYRALVAPRLKPAEQTVPVTDVRALDVLATALLLVACAGFLVGIDPLAWFFVVIEAIVAAIAATTGVNAATVLYDRIARRD